MSEEVSLDIKIFINSPWCFPYSRATCVYSVDSTVKTVKHTTWFDKQPK